MMVVVSIIQCVGRGSILMFDPVIQIFLVCLGKRVHISWGTWLNSAVHCFFLFDLMKIDWSLLLYNILRARTHRRNTQKDYESSSGMACFNRRGS